VEVTTTCPSPPRWTVRGGCARGGVEQHVQPDDAASGDVERHHGDHAAVQHGGDARAAVDEHGDGALRQPRGEGRLLGDGRGSRDGLQPAPAVVGVQHGPVVQEGQQGGQVAVLHRAQPRVEHRALLAPGRAHGRRVPEPAAGTGGELARGVGGAVERDSDLLEREAEHVVQHEGEPLGGRQRLQHDQQRDADPVAERGQLGRVAEVGDRLVLPGQHLPRPLPGPARALQLVEADPRDDGRQPGVEVLDRGDVGALEAQPGLLHGVVGVGRAHELGRDRAQPRPRGLEAAGEQPHVRPCFPPRFVLGHVTSSVTWSSPYRRGGAPRCDRRAETWASGFW
jgi:hypothetical protein